MAWAAAARPPRRRRSGRRRLPRLGPSSGPPPRRSSSTRPAAAEHGRRRRGPAGALLPFVQPHRRRASSSTAASSWGPRPARAATRTSSTSGTKAPTTSRPSTTSGTGSPSSTCRRSRAPSRPMVRRLPRSRPAVLRDDGEAGEGHDPRAGGAGRPRVHRLPRDHPRRAARWARATTPSATRRSTGCSTSGNAVIQAAARLGDLPRPRAPPRDLHAQLHAQGVRQVLLRLPQGAPRRAGQLLPLVPRVQRVRRLAEQRRVDEQRARLLPSEGGAGPASTATCRRWRRATPRPRTA